MNLGPAQDGAERTWSGSLDPAQIGRVPRADCPDRGVELLPAHGPRRRVLPRNSAEPKP